MPQRQRPERGRIDLARVGMKAGHPPDHWRGKGGKVRPQRDTGAMDATGPARLGRGGRGVGGHIRRMAVGRGYGRKRHGGARHPEAKGHDKHHPQKSGKHRHGTSIARRRACVR